MSMRGIPAMLVFMRTIPSNEHAQMKLERKIALVTGAANGIGKAIATAFGREGARLLIADRVNAEVTAAEMNAAGFEAIGVRVDITSEDDVGRMASVAAERFG